MEQPNPQTKTNPFLRFVPLIDRRALKHRVLPTLYFLALLVFFAFVLALAFILPYPTDSTSDTLPALKTPPGSAQGRSEASTGLPDPCGLKDVVCPGEKPSGRTIRATVTTYQAVPEQTDATPCAGAMAGVNFCQPPFPIVANNCLKLGTKVEIRGTTYTVADRLKKGTACEVFDVLTSGNNYHLINEPITVL